VYTPNSFGGAVAAPEQAGEGSWETDGELIRAAQTLHSEDGDFVQAGILYREVFTEESKQRLVKTLVGQYEGLTIPVIKDRFVWYWTSVDAELGAKIVESVGHVASADPVGVA
jgi:catalase